jgi:DNA-binding transcriptional MerR regulator
MADPDDAPAYRSIGEVLGLLREEFPEVTISKIRFLESQGLIAPERTPSGYRKFYGDDIARLRWILRQQKDHFLPLRVIKERLDQLGDAAVLDDTPLAELLGVHDDDAVPAPAASEAVVVELALGVDPADAPELAAPPGPPGDGDAGASAATVAPGPEPVTPVEPGLEAVQMPAPTSEGGLTRSELAALAGVREQDLVELEAHGLLPRPTPHRDQLVFDDDAATVARLARAFAAHGIEPRHLKMYKHFAEREAALFEQLVMPYVRQRNPEARAQAQRTVAELAGLGRELRTVMLRAALQGAFEPR